MKKKLFLSLFLAITATAGIIWADNASTRKISFVLSDGSKLTKLITENLINQSNVLKQLSADSLGNYIYQVQDPNIVNAHLLKLTPLLKFAENNDFSNPENIRKAIANFKEIFPKMFIRPGMYEEDVRIAKEFDIPKLKLALDILEGPEKKRLAKENYFATGDASDPHFKGISIQDLIDHDRMPPIQQRQLKLNGKHISSLDGIENIQGLQNLQVLDLSSNRITSIPSNIQGLQSLQALRLGGNQITTIPSHIHGLPNLQMLNLSNNQIRTIPNIQGLQNLRTLFLMHNQISSIPSNIQGLQNLQALFLSNNPISSIPSNITGLQNLQNLTLDRNLIPSQSKITQLQDNMNASRTANQPKLILTIND